MSIVWKKKKPLENYEDFFIDVICAKVKDVSLKIFCVKDPDKKNFIFVTWIANNYPNKDFHVSGQIHCAKDLKAGAYKLAKNKVEAFVGFWFKEFG